MGASFDFDCLRPLPALPARQPRQPTPPVRPRHHRPASRRTTSSGASAEKSTTPRVAPSGCSSTRSASRPATRPSRCSASRTRSSTTAASRCWAWPLSSRRPRSRAPSRSSRPSSRVRRREPTDLTVFPLFFTSPNEGGEGRWRSGARAPPGRQLASSTAPSCLRMPLECASDLKVPQCAVLHVGRRRSRGYIAPVAFRGASTWRATWPCVVNTRRKRAVGRGEGVT